MLRPDNRIVGLHELGGRHCNLGTARNHPRQDTDAIRESDDALRHGFPQRARDGARIERHHGGERDHVYRVGMVEHAGRAAGHVHANRMNHEMRREFRGRHAAIFEAPHDTARVSFGVDLDDPHIASDVEGNVAHVAPRARHDEERTAKVVSLNAQGSPIAGVLVEERAAVRHFPIGHAVREVSAVALVPTLLPAIGAQARKALHERLLLHGDARDDALRGRNSLVYHVLRAIEETHRFATFHCP